MKAGREEGILISGWKRRPGPRSGRGIEWTLDDQVRVDMSSCPHVKPGKGGGAKKVWPVHRIVTCSAYLPPFDLGS